MRSWGIYLPVASSHWLKAAPGVVNSLVPCAPVVQGPAAKESSQAESNRARCNEPQGRMETQCWGPQGLATPPLGTVSLGKNHIPFSSKKEHYNTVA